MGKAQSYSGTPLRNVPEWEMGGHGAAAALRAARKTHGHGHFAAGQERKPGDRVDDPNDFGRECEAARQLDVGRHEACP